MIPAAVDTLRTEMCRHTPAHRLAADEQPMATETVEGAARVDRRTEALLQHRRLVRNVPSLVHVREVERHHVDAPRRKPFGGADHERMPLASARAMSEDKQHFARFGGGVVKRVGLSTAFEFNGER